MANTQAPVDFTPGHRAATDAVCTHDRPRETCPTCVLYRQIAREQFQVDGEIEVDDFATVSDSEDGAYVQAWVWVYRQDAEEANAEG